MTLSLMHPTFLCGVRGMRGKRLSFIFYAGYEFGMNLRKFVSFIVIEIKIDDDPVEHADGRHGEIQVIIKVTKY